MADGRYMKTELLQLLPHVAPTLLSGAKPSLLPCVLSSILLSSISWGRAAQKVDAGQKPRAQKGLVLPTGLHNR